MADIKKSYKQTTFNYQGFNRISAVCGLEIHRKGDSYVVVLTELPENPGTSITNAIEVLATQVYHKVLEGVDPKQITWIEHYPERQGLDPTDHYDKVSLDYEGTRFINPWWERVNIKELLHEYD